MWSNVMLANSVTQPPDLVPSLQPCQVVLLKSQLQAVASVLWQGYRCTLHKRGGCHLSKAVVCSKEEVSSFKAVLLHKLVKQLQATCT